jgi:hypothetical protein
LVEMSILTAHPDDVFPVAVSRDNGWFDRGAVADSVRFGEVDDRVRKARGAGAKSRVKLCAKLNSLVPLDSKAVEVLS